MYAIGNLSFLVFPTRIARTTVGGSGYLEWGLQLNQWIDVKRCSVSP